MTAKALDKNETVDTQNQQKVGEKPEKRSFTWVVIWIIVRVNSVDCGFAKGKLPKSNRAPESLYCMNILKQQNYTPFSNVAWCRLIKLNCLSCFCFMLNL